MKVRYLHPIPGIGKGNIYWEGKFPARGGFFPARHPAAPGNMDAPGFQFGAGERMDAMRSKGYWFSCFPEGDGICFDAPEGRTAQECAADIAGVFGWEVKIVRADLQQTPEHTATT